MDKKTELLQTNERYHELLNRLENGENVSIDGVDEFAEIERLLDKKERLEGELGDRVVGLKGYRGGPA